MLYVMQDGESIKRKDEERRETIEQAHLLHTQTSTEGTYTVTVTIMQGTYTVMQRHKQERRRFTTD